MGHIGVSNVDTIIRLTYGEEYGIHMESLAGNRAGESAVHGTRVTLQLPVSYGEA